MRSHERGVVGPTARPPDPEPQRRRARAAVRTRSGRCPTSRRAAAGRTLRPHVGARHARSQAGPKRAAGRRLLRYHHPADARSRSPRLLFAMSTVIESLERAQLRRVPRFQAGDRVRVHFQVVEGTRRRTQVFEGVVIKRQGHGARETFTVRKQSFGVGVERTFPVHSPKIEKIEVAARGDVRRAKLYYLRDRVGKAARVRERRYIGPEEVVEAGLLHDPAAQLEAEAAATDGAVDAEGVTAEEVVVDAEGVETRRRECRGSCRGSGRSRRRLRAVVNEPRRRRSQQGEVGGQLVRRAHRHRGGRAGSGAGHPGVPDQAVPDPERVDGPDAEDRPARAGQPPRQPLQRARGRRGRRLPSARGLRQQHLRRPGQEA